MSTRIILIDKNTPEHWDLAKRNGFWDLQNYWRGLENGDTVYFRVTGKNGRFVGAARTIGESTQLPPNAPHAWSPDDARRGSYRYRIDLTDFRDLDIKMPWQEVVQHAHASRRPHPVTLIPESGESWLEQHLSVMLADPYQEALEGFSADPDAAIDVPGLGTDERERVPRDVVIRRGRSAFREALFRAYGGRCVVTRTSFGSILEAAHISGYLGDHTDRVDNGLLLRADIHTLFDLHLLTITATDDTVRLDPRLRSDETYRSLDGMQIDFPERQPRPTATSWRSTTRCVPGSRNTPRHPPTSDMARIPPRSSGTGR